MRGAIRSANRCAPLVLAAALLNGCGGGGSDSATPPGSPPSNPPLNSGLDSRPSNTCVATVQPGGGTGIAVVDAFPNLTFSSPVLMIQAPGDDTKWYVVEQGGVIRVFANDDSTTTASVFVDLRDRVNFGGEAGLLGMAFDPNFATTGRVYLSYTANPVGGGVLQSRISRFTMNGNVLDPGSESVLLTIAQPFSNHNGGNIVFGSDTYLYAGFGDGGSGGDPNNNAQNRSTLLGKLIRIDVSGTGAYTIPADNPFVGADTARCETGTSGSSAMCQEIYAYGFRNPWRFSFDRAVPTDLWLADVGQGAFEEVDRVEKGGNYGWRFREGMHCYDPSTNCPITANGADLIDPVAEYGHDLGSSVTGGYVYRGTAIPGLVGRYLFGDFGSGRIFALASGTFARQELLQTSLSISSFGQGSDGELYVINYGGKLSKIVPSSAPGANPIKTQLSQTGCFSSANPTQPVAGLIPYAPNAPFWSDGATKQRWMGVPDGQRIAVDATTGDFDFPNGTVLVKNFSLNGQLIETRLFMRHTDTGNWGGYTYRWNDAHTDATLVSGGLVADVGGQNWIWPSEAQCLQCHTSAAGGSLGPEVRQLNSNFAYPTGRTANQLDTLEAIGMFTASPVRAAAMPNPADATQPLGDRARAYLHTNCSHCHRPGGGTFVTLDLRYTTAIESTNACNAAPAAGDLGVAGAKIIAPGDAAHSVLYLRMSRRDANQMPPIATALVDNDGAILLQQWISTLNANCQ
jgi:uncharacterized repeat protein (TIGR03806 family)